MISKLVMFAVFVTIGNAHRFMHPMQNPDLYHGDIAGDGHTRNRNAVTSKNSRWPRGVVPFRIDKGLRFLKSRIMKAMSHIEAGTCVTFEEYDGSQKGYIRIFSGDGCYSYWGRTGGQQPVSLDDGCEAFGIIVHELLHALGFDHEQNRSDRDDYLIIYFENIEEDALDQFQKFRPSQNWLITPFDYYSIMIYGEYAFSKDDYSKTMVAKKRGIRLTEPYDKSGLTKSDIKRINVLYECK